LATVTGEVTYEAEPVADGMITLFPADGKGPVFGGRIVDGEYRIENVSPGRKIVQVQAVKVVPFVRSSEEMARRAAVNRAKGDGSGLIDPADTIPANAIGNNSTVDVKSGKNELSIRLTKPAA
jgi:hypothetical protein